MGGGKSGGGGVIPSAADEEFHFVKFKDVCTGVWGAMASGLREGWREGCSQVGKARGKELVAKARVAGRRAGGGERL